MDIINSNYKSITFSDFKDEELSLLLNFSFGLSMKFEKEITYNFNNLNLKM